MKAVLLISHGSYSPFTKKEVSALVDKLRQQSGISIFEFAFLEIEHPSIPEGIDICIQKGATEVVVLLNFLNSGKHVDQDIPRIIAAKQKEYPHILIRMTQPLGHHPSIEKIFLNLLQ